MRVVLTRNAFRLLFAAAYIAVLLSFNFLFVAIGLSRWSLVVVYATLGFCLSALERRFGWLRSPEKIGSFGAGPLRVSVDQRKPWLTRARIAAMAIAVSLWFLGTVWSLVYWWDARYTYVIVLPVAAASIIVIVNLLERRWQNGVEAGGLADVGIRTRPQ